MSNHAGLAPAPESIPPRKKAVRFRQPALRVLHGEFGDPPPAWRILDERRVRIQELLPSVGRIRQGSFVLGTGILVARNVVLTARHVAEAFSTDVDGVAKIRVGWNPVVDFIGELPLAPMAAHTTAQQSQTPTPAPKPHDHSHQPHADEPCACSEIRSVIYMDQDHDLALLRVAFDDTRGPEHWRRPRPLELSTSGVLLEQDRPVYLIGFPRQDPTATDDEVRTVLGTHFGVKRVQPGYITSLTTGDKDASEFEHDASTLKGNSGSCVVDVETNQVIGVHTRGSREAEGEVSFNRAIAFSRLEPQVLATFRMAGIELSGGDIPRPQTP
jgi:Trypsin-like peptidase domain